MTATARIKQAAVAEQSKTGTSIRDESLDSDIHSEKHLQVARKAALKDLDMAVMMGGPCLQPYAHSMIKVLMSELASTESPIKTKAQTAEGNFCLHKALST